MNFALMTIIHKMGNKVIHSLCLSFKKDIGWMPMVPASIMDGYTQDEVKDGITKDIYRPPAF